MSKESDIKTILIPASEFETIRIPDNILGIVEFNDGKNVFSNKVNKSVPYLDIHLSPLLKEPYIEVWMSENKVNYGATSNFQFANDGKNLFAAGSFKQCNYSLDELAKNIYNAIFNDVFDSKPHYPCRTWNYIPYINQSNNNLERYKAFCSGRSISFADNNYEIYPASTGIGSLSGNLNVYFLSSFVPNYVPIENPRQIPSYKYLSLQGQKPPVFARALCHKWSDDRFNIYISGTASIVEHESICINDTKGQCLTTLENIKILLSKDNLKNYSINNGFTLKDLDCIKVYIRNNSDFPAIKSLCKEYFSPDASIAYLEADICRDELLVEIEGSILFNR